MMCEFFRIEGFAMTNIANGKQSNYSFNAFVSKIPATVLKRNRSFCLISALTTCWLILASANVIGQSTREYTYSGGKLTGVDIKNPIRYGDVNSDGVVDEMDVIVLERYLARWPIAINEAAADVNGDGVVDEMDVIVLERYLARWPGYETLPIQP